jgi:Xaa-Pro aminopeptidase
MTTELDNKTRRLSEFLDRHGFDGALLTLRSNFAWITCGRDNHIANNTPVGVASILVTKDGKRVCVANAIEAPRMKDEELAGTGIETASFPWHDGAVGQKVVRELIAGRKIASDSEAFGLHVPPLPAEFNALRWELTEEEIARYREGGKRASRAMEAACKSLRRGMSEHDAAAALDLEIHRAGMNPLVTLVASDERIRKFRHPIPKDKAMQNVAMLVTCAEFHGLIACLTRFVAFSALTDEQKSNHQAICNIDAAVNLATKPGRTLGEIFDVLAEAYHDAGHVDEWKNHHQGGSCGYQPRDVVAVPGTPVAALANQAFAWNPSIPGAKCEDTILCTANGIEVLTPHSHDWPTVVGKSKDGELRRAGILVV